MCCMFAWSRAVVPACSSLPFFATHARELQTCGYRGIPCTYTPMYRGQEASCVYRPLQLAELCLDQCRTDPARNNSSGMMIYVA